MTALPQSRHTEPRNPRKGTVQDSPRSKKHSILPPMVGLRLFPLSTLNKQLFPQISAFFPKIKTKENRFPQIGADGVIDDDDKIRIQEGIERRRASLHM